MKTYKKSKLTYAFPEVGTKAWINQLKEACKHPGFKLKKPDQKAVDNYIKEANSDLTTAEYTRYQVALSLVQELAD